MMIGLRGCGEIVEIVSLGGGSDLVMIDFTWRILYFQIANGIFLTFLLFKILICFFNFVCYIFKYF